MRPNIALSSGKPLTQIITQENHDEVIKLIAEDGSPSRIDEYVSSIFCKTAIKSPLLKINALVMLERGSEFLRLIEVDNDDESVSINQKPVFELGLSTCLAIKGFSGLIHEIKKYVFESQTFVGKNKAKIFAGILFNCMKLNALCRSGYDHLTNLNPRLFRSILNDDIIINLDEMMESESDND